MSTKVEKTVTVDLPVSRVYNQWTQFEEFPEFMSGVQSVEQVSDTRLHWVAEIGGIKREWDATILEQVPDRKVAWAATEGATNAGAVYFQDLGAGQTSVRLELEYEPEGLVEKAGDALGIVERRAEADLQKFKEFIEERGFATGGWRDSVNEGAPVGAPGVEAAAGSRGDSGKAGVSGKLVAGAAVAAGLAGAAAAAAKSGGGESSSGEQGAGTSRRTLPETEVVTPPPTSAQPPAEPVRAEPVDTVRLPGEEPPAGGTAAEPPRPV